MGLLKMKDVLPHLLRVTTKHVYLDSFKLTERDLQMVFNYSYKTETLTLANCDVSHLGESFTIPPEKEYRYVTLG